MRHPETKAFRKWEIIIRDVMMQQWDPIGVSEYVEAKNEYDIYIPTVYRILREGKSVEYIFDYLRKVEEEQMGLKCNFDVTMAFSIYLHTLSKEINSNNKNRSAPNEDE